MNGIWDSKTDAVKKGDKLRDVTPYKTYVDDHGITHHLFHKTMFHNPWYSLPDNELELFKKFLEGGSRAYPSDGNIPCDIVAQEARKILKKIVVCSENPNDNLCEDAIKALEHGKHQLVRGTLKLYLGKYTTRDWRRKRFTDDIDFWTFQINVLERSLKECGFVKSKESGEWVKKIEWTQPEKSDTRKEVLFAANNLNQLLDFGAGSYLEGSSLKEIFSKKIKRGHDVDLSDIINIAMVNDGIRGPHKEEWLEAWAAFEEAANQRNSRSTSNIISLCQYSLAIADYIEKVHEGIKKYHELIFNKSEYPDDNIKKICKISIHWEKYLKDNGLEAARRIIHDFLVQQMNEKPHHARNLRAFVQKLLELLNSKYKYLKIAFEIEA